MYEAYVSYAEYVERGGTILNEADANKYLIDASRKIDTLTYNRILDRGWDALTEFQQEIIQEVVCSLAEFTFQNADLINAALSSYSINGVSMSFNGSGYTAKVINGVAILQADYTKLRQTGLMVGVL